MNKFKINSFASGVHLVADEALLKPYEAAYVKNCNIETGALKTIKDSTPEFEYDATCHSLTAYYGDTPADDRLVVGHGTALDLYGYGKTHTVSGREIDYVNFENDGQRVLIGVSSADSPFMIYKDRTTILKNRRKVYNDDGSFKHFVDANGHVHQSENTINTFPPRGDFMELHYDRLWIAGDTMNPDRLYFSTANVNGADIQDWTVPLAEEGEINMHGGFLDVRSYDGGRIIGMKVAFNSVCIFKETTAYKVYGNSPSNYQLVQMFSSSGAIANKSIVSANNGIYYLNRDGIYFYDGTNTNCISDKIRPYFDNLNENALKSAVAWYHKDKYYLGISTTASSENDMVITYDTRNQSFIFQDDMKPNGWVHFHGKDWFIREHKLRTYKTHPDNKRLVWETPWYDFGVKTARKMSTYIYFRASGDGELHIVLQSDRGKTKELFVTLSHQDTVYRKKLKLKGRMFKMTFMNANRCKLTLAQPELICELDED